MNGPDQLGILFFKVEHADVRAQSGQNVEQRGAGWVQSERIEQQSGAWKKRRCAKEECCGGDIARDCGIDRVKRLRSSDGNRIDGAVELCSKGAQGQFAVVAGAHCLSHGGGSIGLQAGKQNACFYLGAGNRSGVVDRLQRAAVNGNRRVAIGERDVRAHGFKRLANALHGTARERSVSDESEGTLLRREKSGDHAHG